MILCLGTTPAAQRVMVFDRLIPDAVNRAMKTLDGAAGKGINVAKVLQALGEKPVAIGFLGGVRGASLEALLQQRGLELDMVRVNPGTRECVTVIDRSGGTQTELVEESQPVDPSDYDRLLEIVRRRLPSCRAVVMSGTIPPGGPVDFYAQAVRLARAAGALCVIDAHGAPLAAALSEQPDLVKPNRSELAAMLGVTMTGEPALQAAIRELRQRGARRVVITAGSQPTLAFDGRGFWRITPPRVTPLNPIGSGDAFTAGLVSRLLRGDDLGEACRWGSAAGAANALTWMAGEVQRAEVERLHGETRVERIPDRAGTGP